MSAICRCINNHTWNARVLEDDPSTNSMTLVDDDNSCPECGADDFEIINEEIDIDDYI